MVGSEEQVIVEPVKAGYGELWARLLISSLVVAAITLWLASAWGRMPVFVLQALQSLPVYKHDRGPEHSDRKALQLQAASAAIDEAAKGDKDLAAMLVTVGHHESAWSLAIMNGYCLPKQCDPDRDGVPRAHSNYQLHRVAASSREAWEAARTDLRVATQEAAFVLRRMRSMCRGEDVVRRTLTAYAGRGCGGRLKDIEKRMDTYRKVRGGL